MNITPYRREFTVFVVDGDFGSGELHTSALRALGYDAKTFPTVDSALAAAKVAPPHVTIFNLEALEVVSERFLTGLAEISPEILTIILVGQVQVLTALQQVSSGLAFDYVVQPMVSTLELTQKVDRAASQLFFQFESEQLRESAGASRDVAEAQPVVDNSAHEQALEEARSSSAAAALAEFNEFHARLTATKDLEPAAQAFMEAVSRRLGGSPALYLKYIPQHVTLAVAQAAWLPIEKLRGVGVDLRSEDPSKLMDSLTTPESIAPLKTLLRQAFRLEKFMAFPHMLDGEPIGVFVIFAEATSRAATEAVLSMRMAFEATYKRNQILKEKHALDIFDPGTGLLNRRGFAAEIDHEIVRARRILMPVSLVCIGVDGFSAADDSKAARARGESIVKIIAAILKKTARVNDFIGRTGQSELMFLLPHTDGMGAAVKGERARRAVETMKFPPHSGVGPVTVSIGVSEYPAHCGDADGLFKTADEALWQVKRIGGNKVCLATPPNGFTPDFEARTVPFEAKMDRESERASDGNEP